LQRVKFSPHPLEARLPWWDPAATTSEPPR